MAYPPGRKDPREEYWPSSDLRLPGTSNSQEVLMEERQAGSGAGLGLEKWARGQTAGQGR